MTFVVVYALFVIARIGCEVEVFILGPCFLACPLSFANHHAEEERTGCMREPRKFCQRGSNFDNFLL